jgi:hypothetical protein
MTHLKITFWKNKFDRVSPLLAFKKGSKSTFWAISPVSSVVISLKKKFGVFLGHIEFFLLRVHSGQVAGNVWVFFIEYTVVHFHNPQWSTALGGNSQKWVSTKSGMFFSHHILPDRKTDFYLIGIL